MTMVPSLRTGTARRVAALMLACYAAGLGTGLWLALVNEDLTVDGYVFLPVFTMFMVVGALIVANRPENAIGWAFSGAGLLLAAGFLSMEWALHAYLRGLPGVTFAAWIVNWHWYPLMILALVVPLLLFPTGRLVSRRWRPVGWALTGATLVITGVAMLRPQLGFGEVTLVVIDNPIGIEAIGDPEKTFGLLFLLPLGFALAALASLVVRFRRARGTERQQLKWFVYGAAVVALLVPLADVEVLSRIPGWEALSSASFALIPLAIGIAILRHKLWDIDRLINRTLVYGVVTAILAGVYGLLALALGSFAGQDSSLVVAGATLAVAAAFQPLRRRVQALVDQRFNRSRYDAELAIGGFSARLRNQIELDALSGELLAVVEQTVQPAGASLWLRGSTRSPLPR
jgi:hypothetical protein